MKIEYRHASKYGNGAKVAAEFDRQMAVRGVTVEIHHIKGPLEDGWQHKVENFAGRIPVDR